MQEVEERTEGALELGPGTLYRSIKQLLQRKLIVEVESEPGQPVDPGNRRRLYSLTAAGKARTAEEAQRLRELVRWAEDAMVLDGGRA
jgi:DNA-binding PadR family transcriptional regulator